MQPGELHLDQTGMQGADQTQPDTAQARTRQADTRKRVNVGQIERALSALGGGFLAYKGLRHGGLTGVALAIAGVAVAKRGITGHCGLYQRMNLDTHAQPAAHPEDYYKRGIHVDESVTVQAPAAQVFSFWRNFENLSRFMKHVKSVRVLDDARSHWVVLGPTGQVEWDAEIINEEADHLISWRSLPGSEVNNAGTVQFREAPHGRGTEVRVILEYLPPAGVVGVAIAKLMGKAPGMQVRDDLRRLRQILETGEVPTTQGQPTGRTKSINFKGRLQTAAIAGFSNLSGKTDRPSRYARRKGNGDETELHLGLPPRLGGEDHGGSPAGYHHDQNQNPINTDTTTARNDNRFEKGGKQ